MDIRFKFIWPSPIQWFLIGLVFALLFFSRAYAQEVVVPETVVNFEWGDLLGIFLTNLVSNPDSAAWTVFGIAMSWVVLKLPQPLQWAWRLFQVEQLLAKSLVAGINSTAGAVQGKRLAVDVGNKVIANSLQYGIDNGSKAAIDFAGGPNGIRNKLIARLDLDENASIPLAKQ